jgi:hypothetical protein
MNFYADLKELGYMWFYTMLALAVLYWYIEHVKENAAVVHYWRGRKDGWDMHRRMIANKVKTDEVFDYDKD